MSKSRILFIANGILGWNTYSQQVESILRKRDDIEAFVHWRRPGRLSTALVKRHDARHEFERYIRRIPPLTAYRGWLGRDIRQIVRDTKPDIVHFASHWPASALLSMNDAPRFTVSMDATKANIKNDFKRGHWKQTELDAEARFLAGASRIYPMTRWVSQSLRRDYAIDDNLIRLVPPAEDLSGFAPKQEHAGLPNLVFVGNDFHRKGGQKLVDWVNGPLADRCHLHIISGDPEAEIQGPNITFHGRVPHDRLIGTLLPRMDILCLPTSLDMSALVLLEAAAAGIPAVTYRLGGLSDIVLDGQTGLLVPPGDESGFVAALEKLIESATLRREMGVAARAHAYQNFNADDAFNHMIDDILALAQGSSDVAKRAFIDADPAG